MLKIDRVQLEIEIKTDKTQQALNKFDQEITEATKQLRSLERQKQACEKQKIAKDDEGAQAIRALKLKELESAIIEQKTKVKQLNSEYHQYVDGLDLTDMSVRQLIRRQKELNSILNTLNPNTPQYEKLKQELGAINLRMKELKTNATEAKFSLSKMADGMNKYAMVVTTAIATVTGLTMSMRKSVQDYADMQEAQSQVIKYCNMSAAAVDDLNESFKKMDTRTSRQRLNELAGDAGKLGIVGKQNILDFVEAANQIDISLGDDLGKDAIKNIGKLANMFGDDKTLGLKQAMLASGSAINRLGQSSSAAEEYVLDFTYRLAGVGIQANLTQTQIMGLGAVLDQNGQQVETSATSVSQLITKMYQDPAKFAKLAGISVKEFTHLLKTDANDAILKFLGAMRDKGGFAALAPMFEGMGLNGSRATGVLSTLASKLDDVKKNQKEANQAYQEATSITQEYNKQNSTVQAGIDKAKKGFLETSIALGEKLEPAMKYVITSGSAMTKGLLATMDVVYKYRTTLTVAAVALVAYGIAAEAATIKSKALAFWNNICVTSFKAVKTAIMSSPWAAVATVIALVGAAMFDLSKKTGELTQTQKSLKDIEDKATASVEEQKTKVETLKNIVHDSNVKLSERYKAINLLKSIVPGYTAQISAEGKVYNENTLALTEYINKLKEKALLEGAKEELKELGKKRAQLVVEGNDLKKKAQINKANAAAANRQATYGATAPGAGGAALGYFISKKVDESKIKDNASEIKGTDDAINTIISSYGTALYSNDKGGGVKPPAHNNSAGLGESDKEKKKREKEREERYNKEQAAAEEAYKKELAKLKKQKKDLKITDEEYHKKSYDAEIAYLGEKGKIQKKYGKSSIDTENDVLDKIINETDYQAAEKKKAAEKKQNDELAALDDKHGAQQIAAAQDLMNGKISTQEEYDAKLKNIEQQYWQDKLAIIKANGGDEKEVLKQILDQEVADKLAAQQKAAQDTKDKIDNTPKISDKTDINDAAYKAGVISYKEYEDNKTKIAEDAAEQRQKITEAAFAAADSLMSSASGLFSALQQSETSRVEKKYKLQIDAAKKAGKDTTKLEEKEEEEKLAIKKKYADKEFALSVLTILAKTAQGIMGVWAEWGWMPAMAIAMSAAVGMEGVMQLATAKAQKDEAAGLYSGGYNTDYVEGYTADGDPHEQAGVIPVHKKEFVASHIAVSNPAVKSFLDVFDAGQKDGSIRLMNTTDILQRAGVEGKYNGGYTQDGTDNTTTKVQTGGVIISGSDYSEMIEQLRIVADYTKKVAEESITLRDLRKNIKHEEKLEKNASR